MEYDSVSNRYFPAGYLKKQPSPKQEGTVERHASVLAPRIVMVKCCCGEVRSTGTGIVGFDPPYILRLLFQDVPQLTCNLPSRLGLLSPGEFFKAPQSCHTRDWMLSEKLCVFGGDDGIWAAMVTDSPDYLHVEASDAIILQFLDHAAGVFYLTPDKIGLLKMSPHGSISPDVLVREEGLSSMAGIDEDRFIYSMTGGQLKVCTVSSKECAKIDLVNKKLAFEKLAVLDDKVTLLAQSFQKQLYLIDLEKRCSLGILFVECDKFVSDGDHLVLIYTSSSYKYRLYDYTSPTDCLLSFTTKEPCAGLIWNGAEFLVFLHDTNPDTYINDSDLLTT